VKPKYKVAIALVAGTAIGGAATQGRTPERGLWAVRKSKYQACLIAAADIAA
jgi:hypothetical protein